MKANNNDYNDRLRKMARDRADRVLKLRAKGMKWAEICDLEGCTRQALSKLILRFRGAEK